MKLFLVQNWHVPYFLYYLFTFNNRSTARIVSILCTCFHIKLFFQTLYDMYRTRTFFQNYSNFSQVSIVKNVNTTLVNITFWCLFFFRSGLTRPVVQPKANRCQNASDTEACTSLKTYRGENFLKVIATSYKTKLQINITCIECVFCKFCHLDYLLLLLLWSWNVPV